MPFFRRALVPALGAVTAVLLTATAASASVTLNRDFDTCNNSQWTGNAALEAGTPSAQQGVTSTYTRAGTGCASIFETANTPGDKWSNGTYRSMWGQYDSQDGAGANSDFVYGFSFETGTAGWLYQSIWELHQRANIYTVSPNLAIAPHAVLIENGKLVYREMTGPAVWNGSQWTGWSNYQGAAPLTGTLAALTWYDVAVHIHAAEDSAGSVDVYVRQAGQPWPSTATWHNSGPSLPYIPAGKDPQHPNKISTLDNVCSGGTCYTGMYLEAGLYNGSTSWQETQQTIDLVIDNLRRYSDLTSAKAGFPS